jgi:hypothetical protein
MRWFDSDRVGLYLDHIDHRVEATKDGKEIKMIDLTLRLQPFTPALAVALDEDVRAMLFTMTEGEPKPKIKSMEFRLPCERQQMIVQLVPEDDSTAARTFLDVEITAPRARTEKGVDGYGFVFYASFGPVSKEELEYICTWYTQQRFVTFAQQEPSLDFGEQPATNVAQHTPRRRRSVSDMTGDTIRDGVQAEH